MKLAYVTIFDPADIHAWSGLGVYILKALREQGTQVETIGNLKYTFASIYKAKEVLYGKLLSKTYRMLWDPILLKLFARQVEQALAASDCDAVFSIWTNPVAYLRTEKPLVFWGDATFAGLVDFYPRYSNLCAETIRGGHRAEQLALSKCRLAIYSSAWAAESAVQQYHIDPAKVAVVPFGANVTCRRTPADIEALTRNKRFDACKLLFMGVNWHRKGGDLALEIAEELNRRGLPTELHLAGCEPPTGLPAFVKSYGFVSKKTPEGRRLLDRLLSESHFLILPSRADCTPVVFAEANSFGLPCLASQVGGIPTVIQDGKNGWTFPLDAGPAAYCEHIETLMRSEMAYRRLALSAFREYAERLNWTAAGRRVHDLLHTYCGSQDAPGESA
ncbi:MAG: glycosyltransferase family 4 protein [Anaerolineae bacterium]|nr:glycosyltransferase family 4 protein [Anaerolineae bacterium]